MANGGPGNDYLVNSDAENYGFDGHDTIIVSRALNGGHVAYIEGGNGNDYIEINRDSTLAATIFGGFGDNVIIGGYLGDTLTGGGNNDLIYGAGTNTPSKFSLDNDEIWGGAGIDGLYGLQGNDVIHGGSEDDRATMLPIVVGHDGKQLQLVGGLYGDAGNDKLYGEEGSDDLFGGSGNDYLDGGGGGLNRLFGGTGDDTYLFNGLVDEVYEDPGAGYDMLMVIASKDNAVFSLPVGLEIEEVRIGSTFIRTLAGNEYSQVLRGNDLDNSFFGGGGADAVHGMGGKDLLSNQGGGADKLHGGADDDSYIIYDATASVFEVAGEGHDELVTYVAYTLTPDAEIEDMRTASPGGKDPLALTGNILAQTITGNAGDNVLHDGGRGAVDVLAGGVGNDTYRVFNADHIIERAGEGTADVVTAAVSYVLTAGASIERMQTNSSGAVSAINLSGNELGQVVVGNTGENVLDGRAGNDELRGLGGRDVLIGGLGADKFVFSTPLGSANIDTIKDFSVKDDTIQLDDAIFAAFAGRTSILPGHFRINTTGLAQDASDHIIYDIDDGKLFYDADGMGNAAGARFGTIATGLALTNADFMVI